ncbi:hypothetical protein [Streptomyces sp. NPDC054987]
MAPALCALLLLAALAGPLALRLRRSPAFVTGRDGRLSTSTALALAWTVILVWLLLTVLGYGLTAGGGVTWFGGTDGPLSPLTTVYLPLLGGPYLALIAAKTVVGLRVAHGTLAKPAAPPPLRAAARCGSSSRTTAVAPTSSTSSTSRSTRSRCSTSSSSSSPTWARASPACPRRSGP